MSSDRALKHLKKVWGRSGIDHLPAHDETKGVIVPNPRKRSARTARLDLRITPDEKKRTELIAVMQETSINEIYSRMLDLYEQHHGRIEMPTPKEAD
jgi:hypothetical protein